MTIKSRTKRLAHYFIQGLIVLTPVTVTGYLLFWLFEMVDGLLRPYLNIPGLGFLLIITFVVLVGRISSSFVMGGFMQFFDSLLERTPGIKFIYTSTKDFMEAFAGNKRKFNKAILAELFAPDVWVIGFVTDEELSRYEMGENNISVYIPHAYSFSGQLYIVPKDKIKPIEKISAGNAMKYAITGGVAEVGNES